MKFLIIFFLNICQIFRLGIRFSILKKIYWMPRGKGNRKQDMHLNYRNEMMKCARKITKGLSTANVKNMRTLLAHYSTRFSEHWCTCSKVLTKWISDTMESTGFGCRTSRYKTGDVISAPIVLDDTTAVLITYALSHFLFDFPHKISFKMVNNRLHS